MKRKILITALASLLFTNWGCESYLDINHDPNVLENVPDGKVMLPISQVGLANNLMGWDFGIGGAFWSQYWTQTYSASQFKTLCEYQANSFELAYGELTAGTLCDLERIKATPQGSGTDNKGNYFVAEALSIYTWQIMTDVWGDIPYFEALKGDKGIVTPHFDKGSDIYADLNKRIDALLKVDLSKSSVDEKYDFVYAGDLNKWLTFVNSLKLKLMLRVSEAGSYNNAAAVAFIESHNLLTSSAKISGSIWTDTEEGKRHPLREFETGGAGFLSTNVIACKSFVNYLDTIQDPRIATLFVPQGGVYSGAFFGDFDSREDSDGNNIIDKDEKYSTVNIPGNLDIMLMSNWEVYFYIAEVYAREVNNVKAKEYYDLGVKASLAQHGISNLSIINAGGKAEWKTITTPEEGIKQIAMQKWVANANYQHIESVLERNRTKYPSVNTIDIKADRQAAYNNFPTGDLTLSVAGRAVTNGKLPSSPTYPDAVITRNPNSPSQKNNLTDKVWWDKKAGL